MGWAKVRIILIIIENNALANYHEKSAMQKLIDSGEATKESLDAASCALLKCAAEFTEGSAEKAYYEQLEKIGNQPEYANFVISSVRLSLQ